jgi:hypothetical protein
MKTSPEDVTILLVGGGSIVAPDTLVGVGEIVRPPYFDVANAVGAAMAKGKSSAHSFGAFVINDHYYGSRWRN